MTAELLSKAPSVGSVLARAAISPLVKRNRRPELPALTLGLDGVRTDASKLAAFNKVCGFDPSAVPATWLHILAFPVHGALLTDERFPFPMIGLVHISNTITQHRAITVSDAVDIRARLGKLTAHDKGLRFSILTDITLRGEKVWEEESVYLRRGRFQNAAAATAEAPADDVPLDQPQETSTWELGEDLGRRYGAASGDMNPIHLHALTARAFGFKRAIAHGMWTQSHALAVLSSKARGLPFTLSTHFKLPAFLPAKVTFRTLTQGRDTLFEVRDKTGEKPHARGRISLLG